MAYILIFLQEYKFLIFSRHIQYLDASFLYKIFPNF